MHGTHSVTQHTAQMCPKCRGVSRTMSISLRRSSSRHRGTDQKIGDLESRGDSRHTVHEHGATPFPLV